MGLLRNLRDALLPRRGATPGDADAGSHGPAATRPLLLATLLAGGNTLDLARVGRTLLHATFVGFAAGLVGAGFLVAVEWVEAELLEGVAGYGMLRAVGEIVPERPPSPFRPWILVLLPGLGALVSGVVCLLAPEARGGGADATIDAFHHQGGLIRLRVLFVKFAASVATLGSGGAGGREGPTMQIGGAIGSLAARVLRVSARERRILLLAGVAAGISAVFRTPLGAALLAVEFLYRDGFETDALVPAVLSSVMAYSVVHVLLGSGTLFGTLPAYGFVPAHLPLYVAAAIAISLLAALFVGFLSTVRKQVALLPLPDWARPAIGGCAVGLLVTILLLAVGDRIKAPGTGLGLLGGGYGAVQVAITGAPWLPDGWGGVQLLLILCGAKLVVSGLTIGSGGSAGDFAPSMTLGALLGGSLGRAAQILFDDPAIDPSAFALVGMATFYGGVANVPLSAMILVSEMAGSYELLVPLMLSLGVSFVALRRVSLYEAQVATPLDSPAHARAPAALRAAKVRDRLHPAPHVHFRVDTPAEELPARASAQESQEVFPVLDRDGRLAGVIGDDTLRALAADPAVRFPVVAADVMQPPVWVTLDDDLERVARLLLAHRLRAIPVRDEAGQVVGFIDETEVVRLYGEIVKRPSASRSQSSPALKSTGSGIFERSAAVESKVRDGTSRDGKTTGGIVGPPAPRGDAP